MLGEEENIVNVVNLLELFQCILGLDIGIKVWPIGMPKGGRNLNDWKHLSGNGQMRVTCQS
jgi:hypothetical protein